MTCSELMTLEEEYETRKQWAEHGYTGTFLIMDAREFVRNNGSEVHLIYVYCLSNLCFQTDACVGDTNFVQYLEYVELLIMIGDKNFRKRGLARNAVCLMMAHISHFINERVIQASVCPDNIPCIKLLDSLGFEEQETYSAEEKVFILPTTKRLQLEKTTLESTIYKNEVLIHSLLKRSRDYYQTLQ